MDSTVRSEWHSIRPWSSAPRLRPRLTLLVREITSVSATFILSTESTGDPEPSLASLGLTPDESDDEEDDDDVLETKKRAAISDALAKGLSVNVNGARWQRVLIRIDDKTDEAVIIIYGLMPGRQYDIDLGLVQGGQNNSIRQQVITEDSDHKTPDSKQDEERSNSNHPAVPAESTPSGLTPSTSNAPPPSGSHAHSGSTSFTIEDRHKQLQHSLSLLTFEQETLATSLKSVRRDAQKADAALRSEIDILKRASEKHTVAEHRAKQRVLALQEAVKRAQTTTRDMEQQAHEMEGVLPSLKEKKDEDEQVYIRVKEDADQTRQEREKAAETDGRRIEGMKGELASLGNKFERANGKREKVEVTISDLEDQLREIEREIENVEAESLGYDSEEAGRDDFEVNGNGRGPEIVSDPMPVHQHPSYLPVQRQHRPQSQHLPGAIGRPSPPAPIQRPSHAGAASLHQQPWPNPQSRVVNHRSNFSSQQPHWQLLDKSPTQSQVLPNSYAHLAAPDSSSHSSTLSSRAPPFEPSRGFTRVTYRTSNGSMPESGPGHSSVSHTLQRPTAPRLMGGSVAWANTTSSQGG